MATEQRDKLNQLRLRAKLPKIFAAAAAVLLTATAVLIGYYLFFAQPNAGFRMKNFPTALSKDVVATINGYERREMDGEITKYLVRADKAVSFADNHQELENVFLEVFSDDGSTSDKISANKAIYIPAENKNFTAYFAGSVKVETRDQLRVKTEQLTYAKETEIASAEEAIEFERLNIKGKSFGASVQVKEKILQLLRDVEIEALNENGNEKGRLTASSAEYDQNSEKIDLRDTISIALQSTAESGRSTDLTANRATIFLSENGGEDAQSREIKQAELFGDVRISTKTGDSQATKIASNYALYDKPAEKFELKESVHIITVEDAQPTEIRSDYAVYEQPQGRINLSGNASVVQGTSLVQGNVIYAELNAARKVKLSEVRDNALVRQASPERSTEVAGPRIRASFGDDQVMTQANVIGPGTAVLVPVSPGEYSRVTMAAASSINVDFKSDGILEKIVTEGRTNVKVDVPNNAPDAANKSLTADSVFTSFGTGKDISDAVAKGNAELVIDPINASDQNYKTTVKAPRFDCEFFATGNNPKSCVAAVKTKTVRVPTVPSPERGTQNIISDKLIANFSGQSKTLDVLEAVGNAKFTELDRNATSESFVYTAADETLRLRGGEPNVWDSRSRAKAPEIDWDTRNQISSLRGGASTTYYSQGGSGGATPFGNQDKPVYVTANAARFDHRAEQGVFTGNARGWQDNNYVRGERLTISQKTGEFVAEENVQSLLYEAKRKENGVESNQPVFVSAQKLTYNRDTRLMRYENNVDIRQGKDRITGGQADIFLTETNEPSRTEIAQNVVITQPNRRAVADFARYETASETVFLKGNPATIDDAEQGRSQGSQFTVNLKENRLTSEGATKQNSAGRIRSVYKVKTQ